MKHNYLFNRAIRGTIVVGALATALSASIAFADESNPGRGRGNRADAVASARGAASLAHRHAVKGTIKSVDGDKKSFVLTTRFGDLTVTTDEDTKYHAPGDESVAFAQLATDMTVIAQGERPNDTTLLAHRILVKPAKAERERGAEREDRTVTIGALSDITKDGSGVVTGFKVTPTGGTAVTFKVDAETEYTLKGIDEFSDASGKTIRVVSTKNSAGENVVLKVRVPATA